MSVVHIVSPPRNGFSTGIGTHVLLDDGTSLKGVRSIDIHIAPDKVITATIELMCSCEVEATPHYTMYSPLTGQYTTVESIAFEDGTIWKQ